MLPWAQTQNPIFAISRIISNLSYLSFIRIPQPLLFLHKESPTSPTSPS